MQILSVFVIKAGVIGNYAYFVLIDKVSNLIDRDLKYNSEYFCRRKCTLTEYGRDDFVFSTDSHFVGIVGIIDI